MAAIVGQTIGKELMEALGLQEQKVRSIDLHLHVARDEVVTVTVKRLVMDDEAHKVIDILDKYELVKRPDAQDTAELPPEMNPCP